MKKNKILLGLKIAAITVVLSVVVSGIGWLAFNGADNFHAVVKGQVYRSGQLSDEDLREYAKDLHIKSVLNLRGPNEGTGWWEKEVAMSKKLGIKHYDLALSSKYQPTQEQISQLLVVLKEAPKPILIHCAHGADRSGLVSAIYLRYFEHYSCDKAGKQLSIIYGHIPIYRPAMRKAFEDFCRDYP